MESNRQKKIGSVLQNDLVDILQGEVRKNGITNLIISVSKVSELPIYRWQKFI